MNTKHQNCLGRAMWFVAVCLLVTGLLGLAAPVRAEGEGRDANPSTPALPAAFGKISPANAATGLDAGSVTLAWETSLSATDYYYCVDAIPNEVCDSNWHSYNLEGAWLWWLSPATTYNWQVKAVDGEGETLADGGQWWTFTTLGLPPWTPGNLMVTAVSQTQIDLTWEDYNGDTQYQLEHWVYDEYWGNYLWEVLIMLPVGVNRFSDSGLSCSTNQSYRVRAYRPSDQQWSFMTQASGSTLPCDPGAFNKLNPPDMTSGQSTSLTLSWSASAYVTEYLYCLDTSPDDACDNDQWVNVGSTLYANVVDLLPQTTYSWQVRAVNSSNDRFADGGQWWRFTTATLTLNPPETLSALGVNAAQIDLTWVDSNAGTTNYAIERSPAGQNNWVAVGTTGLGAAGWSDVNVTCSSSYDYRVSAYLEGDIIQHSAFSNIASAATWVCLPGAFNKHYPHDQDAFIPAQTGLYWRSANEAEGYQVCIDLTNDHLCDQDAWVDVGNLTHLNQNLLYNITYYWQVRAYNASGMTEADGGVWWSFTTSSEPPLPPVNLAATGISKTQIDLTWEDPNGNAEYDVDVWNPDLSRWQDLTVLPQGATRFNHLGVSCSHAYAYRVTPYRPSDGRRGQGAEATGASWPCDPGGFSKLAPPDGAIDQATTLTLAWSSAEYAEEYLYCVDTTDDDACDHATWSSAGSATQMNVSGLQSAATYYWQVRAVNRSGESSADGGQWRRFTIANITLNPPGDLTATATGPNQIDLTWVDANAGTASYIIERSDAEQPAWHAVAVTSPGDSSWSDPNLTCLSDYRYRVRAYAFDGQSQYSDYSAVAVAQTLVCLPGALVKFWPYNGMEYVWVGTTLYWSEAIYAYGYQYCVDTTNDARCDQDAWVDVGAATFAEMSMVTNTVYYWQVRAYNDSGVIEADNGAWWSFTTQNTAPNAPGELTGAAVGHGQIELHWVDTNGGATFYDVERSRSGQNAWELAAFMQMGSVSFLDTALECAAAYDYRVRAYDPSSMQYSEYAGPVTATTQCMPSDFGKLSPLNLAVDLPETLTLTWESAAQAVEYLYCLDTTPNDACDTGWISAGSIASAEVTGLQPGDTYFWQVKAANGLGETHSNAGVWWMFTIQKIVPVITWVTPADILYGAALGEAQLNATADVPGAFVYTPDFGVILNAGAGQTLTVEFTPADTYAYASATATVQINVLKVTPVITWVTPADILYGAALGDAQLNATADVPGTFVYTPPAGTILDAGLAQALSVEFTPADVVNYHSAAATVQINVLKSDFTSSHQSRRR